LVKEYIVRGSRGKYPYHEGKHLIVAVDLFTFADESGLQQKPAYCLLAGFIASPRQWIVLSHDWEKVLAHYNTPEFHAKDYFGRNPKGNRGLYNKWSLTDTNRFLEDILSIARQRLLYPVGGAISVPDFNSFSQSERKFLSGGFISKSGKWMTTGAPSKPYYFMMNLLVCDALSRADPETKVNFYFDEQNVLQARAIETLRETAKVGPLSDGQNTEQIQSFGFVRSVNYPGIQLADMYCYAWNRYLTKGQSVQDGIHRILETLATKKAKGPPSIKIVDRITLQKLLGRLPKGIQNKLRENKL
jgi:hypothetical protein